MGKKGKKTPKRRYVCIGKIKKISQYDMYKVGHRDLVNNQKVCSWFSVEYVADLQVQGGSNKKHAGKKIDKRLREMVKQPEDQFDEQGYHISFDPLREGNCQFSSTCCVL